MTSALILRIVCEELLSGMLLGYSIARLVHTRKGNGHDDHSA